MTDSGNSAIALGALAIMGFLGFMLYQQKKAEDNADVVGDNLGNLITSIINPPTTPIIQYDSHGCRTDIQQWCPVDKACRDKALTCSSPPPPEVTCWDGSKAEYGYLCPVDTSALAPIVETDPVKQVNDMCYLRGMPVLNVRPGTNCHDALAVMCDRFGPGSKFCV